MRYDGECILKMDIAQYGIEYIRKDSCVNIAAR